MLLSVVAAVVVASLSAAVVLMARTEEEDLLVVEPPRTIPQLPLFEVDVFIKDLVVEGHDENEAAECGEDANANKAVAATCRNR
jgi:hypothetical protein